MAEPETPKIMVDVVIPSEGGIVLIRRGTEPYEGMCALPGGFVEIGEAVENAAVREAKEKTNPDVEIVRLVGVYPEPTRDHNVSVTFLARITGGDPEAATDADEVEVMDPSKVELAFDHRKIVEDALGS